MFVEQIGDVKSIYMINKDLGYLINGKGKIFFINYYRQVYQYILTINKDLEGYTKLVAHKNNIYIFNSKNQKIYAISLNKKVQKWYYYNESMIRKLIDITIYNGQLYLLMINKKNKYVYLNLLDIEMQTYHNILRFPVREDKLRIVVSKGKAYIYNQNYNVKIIYNLFHGQKENLGDDLSLLTDYDNVKNDYFITKDLNVIIIDKDKNSLQVMQSSMPYRVGINTILV